MRYSSVVFSNPYFNTTHTYFIYIYYVYIVLSIFILHAYIVDIIHIKTHNNVRFWGKREENWIGKMNIGNLNYICSFISLKSDVRQETKY